jgi:peptidoglycan/LPS O-acetylase OafA/YrhL
LPTLRHLPQLDGLRALAVAAVAWSHWERPYQFGIPFGAGVHLFYVLSGFLITGILLDVRDARDRMTGVRSFYIRRALRIFPAFYVTLAAAWWADIPPVRETFGWHVTYVSNVQIFATETWPGSISHFWSLAVEEQFYLLWPWLVVFAPRQFVGPAILMAIASAPIFRWWLASLGYRENLLAVLMPGSLDSLAMGAFLALVGGDRFKLLPQQWLGSFLGAGWTAASLAALIVLTGAAGAGVSLPPPLMAAKQTLQAIVFAWLVMKAVSGIRGWPGRILAAAPVVYVGRISYGVYLVHGFAGDLLAAVGVNSREIPEPWRFLVLCLLTLGVAATSWHLMEQPINALKTRFPYAATRSAARARDQFALP